MYWYLQTYLDLTKTISYEYSRLYAYKFSELGTQQHCRDNVTMFSGHTVIGYCIITIFIVATPFRHRDLNIFRKFPLSLKLYYAVALSLSRN